jgi:hypothetical protein
MCAALSFRSAHFESVFRPFAAALETFQPLRAARPPDTTGRPETTITPGAIL